MAGAATVAAQGLSSASAQSATTSPLSGLSAAQALAASEAAGESAGSAHISVRMTAGRTSATFVEDSGIQTGEQIITQGKVRATVILAGGIAYIRGNKTAVTSYFGFSKASASELTNRWISLQSTDSGYATVTSGVTLASVFEQIAPTAHLSLDKTSVVDEQHVVGISGTMAEGRTTLFVAAEGAPLVVAAKVSLVSGSTEGSEAATFSHWGEAFNLTAPAGAIPVSSLVSGG
ncbi:MAG TPA: hypothetical protein VGL60_03890 [Acidimicrobiales bacterium]